MTVKRFHPLIILERGPINTAIIDFLKKDVYQVENEIIDKFQKGQYEEITSYIKEFEEEDLIFEVEETQWIPSFEFISSDDNTFQIEVEDGVDLEALYQKFYGYNISRIIYNGSLTKENPGFQEIVESKGEFKYCQKISTINGDFRKVDDEAYFFNKQYNSCYGKKISITVEGKVKPCIHSSIIIGDLKINEIPEILKEAEKFWSLTKDKIKKCKVCELKYICFDCREIAFREKGDLYDENPNCNYNPLNGNWE